MSVALFQKELILNATVWISCNFQVSKYLSSFDFFELLQIKLFSLRLIYCELGIVVGSRYMKKNKIKLLYSRGFLGTDRRADIWL